MFRAIVVGTDGSTTAGEAVRRARALAEAFGADLHVVNAYQPPALAVDRTAVNSYTPPALVMASPAEPGLMPSALVEWEAAASEDARHLLDTVAEGLIGAGASVTTHAVAAPPAAAILSVAQAVGADLIVVGNRG